MELQQACVNCGASEGLFEDFSKGDFICNLCGFVQPEAVIDYQKEWRVFEGDDKDDIRAEKLDEDFGTLGGSIFAVNFGSGAVSSSAKTLTKYSLIANSAVASRSEKNLKEAFRRINELCELLKLPDLIQQSAKEIIRAFEKRKEKGMRCFKKDAFMVAALLVACRQQSGHGRTWKEASRMTEISEREIKQFYKVLLRENAVKKMGDMKPAEKQAKELVAFFCDRLRIAFRLAAEAQEVAMNVTQYLEGKRPSSIAAASIKLVLEMNRVDFKKQDLLDVADISTNTLRSVSSQLNEHLHLLPERIWTKKKATVTL